MIQLTLPLKITTAEVVETSVTVNNNSPIQDYVHPDDQTQPTFINSMVISKYVVLMIADVKRRNLSGKLKKVVLFLRLSEINPLGHK